MRRPNTDADTKRSTLDLALDYVTLNPGRYIFPIKPLSKFPPMVPENLAKNASNDPAQIRKWHAHFFGCNWGVALKKSSLVVVDVDTKPGKIGQQTYEWLDIEFGWPHTEEVRTPSGGKHFYYDGRHVFALGEHGFGKDIDSPNYVLIAGCTFKDGTSYDAIQSPASQPAPQWFYDLLGRAKERIANSAEAAVDLDKPQFIAWAKDFLANDAVPAIEGRGGEHQTFKIAASLRDQGISEPLAVELMNDIYSPRCDPPWEIGGLTRKVHNAYAYANLSQIGGKTAEADFDDDPPPLVTPHDKRAKLRPGEEQEHIWTRDEICDRWVYIAPLKLFVCRDPGASINGRMTLGVDAFDKAFRYVSKKRLSDELLGRKHNTIGRLEGLVYRPGQGEFIGRCYNLYQPPFIAPTLAETAEALAGLALWNEHLEYLLPDQGDRSLVLNWLAWLLQNMGRKPKHALLLYGPTQGTGKTFIAKVLQSILDPNVSAVTQIELGSSFNRWAMNCKLIVIEELRALDKREAAYKLHTLITEERIPINDKGEKQFQIENCFGIFAMTNHEAAIPLDDSDRRYLVVRTEAAPRDQSYYAQLYQQLDNNNVIAAIAYELLHRDVGTYSAQGRAPDTAAKREMMEAGADDLETWMMQNAGVPPLNWKLVAISDIANVIPRRLDRGSVEKRITNVLKRRFDGVDIGKVRLGGRSADRPRLWAINEGIPTALSHREIAAIYAQQREASVMPADELDDIM